MTKKIHHITIFATLSCPYCKLEKQWLDAHNIQHKLIFVDLSPYEAQKMVEKTGQMGVPVTEIGFADSDPEYVIGFDKPKLAALLGVKG